jgi:chromosome segregation ATPase
MGLVKLIVIYLQETRTLLSNAKEVNVCHHCNGHTNDDTRNEEKNEDRFPAELTELKQEIDTLKQENVKLSEDLNKKTVKLREIEAAQSPMWDYICKMENEKLKLSESLKGSFEVVCILNSELSKLKKENATFSRNLEGKYEESGKRSSENSRLEKENFALNDEIANLPKTSEDAIMQITELHIKNSRELKMKTDLERCKEMLLYFFYIVTHVL